MDYMKLKHADKVKFICKTNRLPTCNGREFEGTVFELIDYEGEPKNSKPFFALHVGFMHDHYFSMIKLTEADILHKL